MDDLQYSGANQQTMTQKAPGLAYFVRLWRYAHKSGKFGATNFYSLNWDLWILLVVSINIYCKDTSNDWWWEVYLQLAIHALYRQTCITMHSIHCCKEMYKHVHILYNKTMNKLYLVYIFFNFKISYLKWRVVYIHCERNLWIYVQASS